MTSTQLKNQIDNDITDKVALGSVTTDDVGGNMKDVVDYVDQEIAALPPVPEASYLVYAALITQSGTSDPVATVLENTTGATFTPDRGGAGSYTLQASSNVLTTNKTAIITSLSGSFQAGKLTYEILGNNFITLSTFNDNGATATDGVMTGTFIEIRIYP